MRLDAVQLRAQHGKRRRARRLTGTLRLPPLAGGREGGEKLGGIGVFSLKVVMREMLATPRGGLPPLAAGTAEHARACVGRLRSSRVPLRHRPS